MASAFRMRSPPRGPRYAAVPHGGLDGSLEHVNGQVDIREERLRRGILSLDPRARGAGGNVDEGVVFDVGEQDLVLENDAVAFLAILVAGKDLESDS